MVHTRLNEHKSHPNPHINFITPLNTGLPSDQVANQLLCALAAQVKPVMKTHGFSVNSLEEARKSRICLAFSLPCAQYEYNAVFAGRNWNNGEVVGKCHIIYI
jgi:DNA-dependent metalloprotease WSS1